MNTPQVVRCGFILAVLVLAFGSARSQRMFQPTRFTVVDAGSAGKPDVVLIPGLSSSRAVWDAAQKQFAPKYRLHLVQINGFAGQPAGPNASGQLLPGIVDELDRYITNRQIHPIVVGHSLGGLLALMLADRYPADAKKLVIVDALPFYGALFDSEATPASIRSKAEEMRDELISANAEQRARSAEQIAQMLALNTDGRKLVASNSKDSDARVFGEAMFEDMQTDLRRNVAHIATPTLVLYPFDATLYGSDSAKVDDLYRGAYKNMPNATLVRVDGSRHFIQLDQPAKLNDLVENFIDR